MARRVNTRFLVIVGLVFLLIIGGGAGFYYFFVMENVEQLIDKGDKAYAQGEYQDAVVAYAKAQDKRPADMRLYPRIVDAVTAMKVESTRDARTKMQFIINTWKQALAIDPGNELAMGSLMDMYYRIAVRHPGSGFVQQMYLDTKAALEEQPDFVLARKYHGIAQVQRMAGFPLPGDEAQKAREDLQAALEVDSDDWDVIYHLALWHVFTARDMERNPGSDPAEVRAMRDQAIKIVADALALAPGDPKRQFGFIQIAYVQLDQPDRALPLLERLENQSVDDPASVELVLETASILRLIDKEPVEREGLPPTTGGLVRAETLLRRALKAHPGDGQLNYELAFTLSAQRRTAEAKKVFTKVIGIKINDDPLTAYSVAQAELLATVFYTNIIVDEALASNDPDEREQLVNEAQSQLVNLADTLASANLHVVRLYGKIDYIQGNWAAALQKLDAVNAASPVKDPHLLLLTASACRRLGQTSAAIKRLVELVELRPEFDVARLELAQLLTREHSFDKALEYIDPAIERNPDDDRAVWIKALILKEAQRPREALDLMRQVDTNRMPLARVNVAELVEIVAGRDKAIEYLTSAFNHDPTYRPVLAMLLERMKDDEQAVQRLIAQARAGGMSEMDLSTIEATMLGTAADIHRTQLDAVTAQAGTPLEGHLLRMQMHQRAGNADAARKELEAAAKLEPDHKLVVDAQLTFAIMDKNWALARQLAERARELNLDDAEGLLMFGKIEIAMGQYDRAIATLKTAVEKRPIFDRAWLMLGDAYHSAGNLHQAAEAYRKAITYRKNNADAHRLLAEVYLKLAEPARALEALKQARDFAPNDSMVQAVYLSYESTYGDKNKALAERERLAKENPADLTNRRQLARVYADLNRRSDALATIDKVISDQGQTLENAATKASIYRALGDDSAGRDVLVQYANAQEQAGKATSDHWLVCAQYLMEINEKDQAVSAFNRAMAIEDPQTKPATLAFAIALYRAGAIEQAALHFEKVWNTGSAPMRVGMQYVESLVNTGQIDKAKRVVEELHKSPAAAENDAMVYVLDARIALAQGNPGAALEKMNQAIKLDPRNALLYVHRGTLLAGMPDRAADAMTDGKTAAELAPSLAAARYLLAALYRARGNSDEAIRQLREVITRDPNEMVARKQLAELYQETGNTRLLRELVDESMRLQPNDKTWHGYLTILARTETDPVKAMAQLQQAWEKTQSPEALVELTSLQIRAGRPELAAALLTEQTELVTQVTLLEALQGHALFAMGQKEDGMKLLARAAARSTTHEQLNDVVQPMISAVGRPTAIQLMKKTADARGDQGYGIRLLLAQMAAEDQDWPGTLALLSSISPDSLDNAQRKVFYYTQGLAYQQSDQLTQAAAAYKSLMAIDADNVQALNNYAYLLSEQLGRHQEGLVPATRAAELASDNAYILDTLGRIQFHLGQLTQAQQTLQKSVKLLPIASNTYHLGVVALKQDRKFEAGQLFEQALNLAQQANDNQISQLARKELEELKAGEED